MAGHGHWEPIKHYKAATDAKRGALFTKLIREITMAAKMGGGDPAGNARLRVAIEAGKAKSLPKENIDRAIKKGTGELAGEDIQEVTYEGYGPAGVALIIEAMTDNPTRTVADVRHKMSRGGGNLGTPGSVSFMFEKKGQLELDASKYADEDAALEAALEAGAEDFKAEPEGYEILTDPAHFEAVHKKVDAQGIKCAAAEVSSLPSVTVPITDPAAVAGVTKLIDALEDHDDVKEVHSNAEMKVEG